MGPRLSNWSLSPIDRYSDNDRSKEELSPAWIEDKETTYFLFSGQGDLPDYTCTEKLLRGQKGMVHHPIIGGVNLPISLCAGIHLGNK